MELLELLELLLGLLELLLGLLLGLPAATQLARHALLDLPCGNRQPLQQCS